MASGTSYFLATRMGSWAKAINSGRNAAAGRPQLPLETPPPLTPPRHFAADCSLHAAAGILLPILQTASRRLQHHVALWQLVAHPDDSQSCHPELNPQPRSIQHL